MKRIFLSFLAVLFVFSIAFSGAGHAESTDYALDEAKKLENMGILVGYPGGNYGLGRTITRAEFAAFIVRALDLQKVEVEQTFKDVPPDKWYYDVIYKAATAGIVVGFPNSTFHPKENITREDMAVMINRMLKYKGIVTEIQPLTFNDKGKIADYAEEAVKRNVSLGIILGYPNDHTFRPKDKANRAEAIIMIYKSLKLIEQTSDWYRVGTISNGELNIGGTLYSTFEKAKNQITNQSNQVVLRGQEKIEVVWMNDGIAYTSGFTTFGDTYVPTGTELNFLGADANSVDIKLAGNSGTVDQDEVVLVPNGLKEGQSYYSVDGNKLVHHIYRPITGNYVSYTYGYAPDKLQAGKRYYSWDGHTFYDNRNTSGNPVTTAYQYFNILPLNTKTSYTAAQLNEYIEGTALADLGKAFKDAEQKYGVNALYLLAHAIHESAWGESDIAQDKHNLFGLGAADSDPYDGAKRFASFKECIDYAAWYVASHYQDPDGAYYYGAMLGNKESGMNMKYASDPFWGQKIAGYMYRIDKSLGGDDFKEYNLGVANSTSLNVRKGASTGSVVLYQFPRFHEGAAFIITGVESNGEGTWYKIYSDNEDFRAPKVVYTYHDGKYDLLSKDVNIAK
ncbi:MAG TPA: S-layer homology domain-containing protein [Bacillales bacterium]